MTRCTNRRTAILTLILGLTLLLCGCQVGGGVFVLPDISTKDSTQGKTQLLAALNKHYYTHFDNSDSSHFIYGNDSAAEAVFLYLQDACNGDTSCREQKHGSCELCREFNSHASLLIHRTMSDQLFRTSS